jgi:hypothetical protein
MASLYFRSPMWEALWYHSSRFIVDILSKEGETIEVSFINQMCLSLSPAAPHTPTAAERSSTHNYANQQ